MRFFLADLGRAWRERSTLLCLALALVGVLAPLAGLPARMTGADRWLAAHDRLLPFVYPLLSAGGYSLMFLRERESGMGKNIRLALGARRYRFARLAVVWTTGAGVLTLPVLALCLLCRHFPRELWLAPLCGAAFAGLSHGLGCLNRRGYIPLLAPWVLCLLLTYAAPYLDAPALWPPLWWSTAIQPGWGSLSLSVGVCAGLMALSAALTALGREEDAPC